MISKGKWPPPSQSRLLIFKISNAECKKRGTNTPTHTPHNSNSNNKNPSSRTASLCQQNISHRAYLCGASERLARETSSSRRCSGMLSSASNPVLFTCSSVGKKCDRGREEGRKGEIGDRDVEANYSPLKTKDFAPQLVFCCVEAPQGHTHFLY